MDIDTIKKMIIVDKKRLLYNNSSPYKSVVMVHMGIMVITET